MSRINIFFKISLLILLVWGAQILFLNQAANFGMNGSDDWGWLFHYDNRRPVENLFFINTDVGNPYDIQQAYSIGVLKTIFGLDVKAFKLVHLFFKALAALSAAYLVFKLTKDKLFAVLVIIFFITFPSTAGILSHIVLGFNYLTIVFLSFFILFYLKSSKNKEKILLASLFFFLALWAGTARAYLIFPIPLVVEFAHLIKKFNIRLFILRIVIFYLLPLGFFVNMPGMSVRFQPYQAILIRLNQITTGNLYTLTLPFQMISSLFIDQRILADILGYVPLPIKDNLLRGFLVINLILLGLSILVGFVINKKRVKFFAAKLMIPTLILQIVFYLFGKLSAELAGVPFKDPQGFVYWLAPLNPTIFQTSLGVYFVILGILLFWEWWNYQRKNKVLMVVVFAWIWSVASELLSFLTTNWWNMILESNDRYVLVCSLGAVVFVAGMLTLCARRLWELQGLVVRKFLPFFY